MGTSQSSNGPTGKSPLVPPWAEGAPKSTPPLVGARLKSFRTQLGKAIVSGDNSHLRSALGHYARTATGGSANAGIRLSGAVKAGSALWGVLSGAPSPTVEPSIDLSKLAGMPCDKAIAVIVNGLVTADGDSEKIRCAMSSALIEALDGIEVFDQSAISEDMLINVMINYLAESIFLLIVNDAGSAMLKAKDATDSIKVETALKELTKVIVDKKMQGLLVEGLSPVNTNQVAHIQREVITEVWREWESY